MSKHSITPIVRAGLGSTVSLAICAAALADSTPQTLPFFQDWTNIGLITVNDDWAGVPGIIGYRGDALVGATGVDPQTILVDGTATPVDVNANQANPNTFTTGGVTEFHIANPVVALQGSGTARAPFILVNLDTTGQSQITVSYILRDIDGSADNSIQPVALHYRIGNTGDFINVPAAFVADASTGPSLSGNTNVITVELPETADNQALVQIRVMTADAIGSDEWIGIDNLCVTSGVVDTDGDGVADCIDNCPISFNPTQSDCDGDGIGDVCDDPCPNDKDGDGIPDDIDNCPTIANPGQEDCNGNFSGDVCDIFFGFSTDINSNGIPDECEPDCNGNTIPDSWDISQGFSLDLNTNGIPDECENSTAIIINEIHADPADGLAGDANNDGIRHQEQDEFVELINNNGGPVDISGWTLSDGAGVKHTFPNGTVLQDQCGLVVFGGGTPTGQFGGMVVQTASSGFLQLNNAGDAVTLRDATNALVTSHTYGSEGGNNTSLTRSPDITGNFVQHSTANPGVLYSPGRTLSLGTFTGCSVLPDADNDGIPDIDDNCVNTPNADQADCDNDGIGDACDTDPDVDPQNGIPDNCEVKPPANLRLNEIRVDETGTDNNEYFELKGDPGQSLNGITLLVLGDPPSGTGATGTIEAAISLQGQVIPADGHFLVCESTFTLAPLAQRDLILSGGAPGGLNFENSDNVTFVLVTNFSGAINDDLDTDNDGVIDVMPWGAVIDAVGVVNTVATPPLPAGVEWPYGTALGFTDIGPDPGGLLSVGHIYRCESDRTWTLGLYNPNDPEGGTDTAGALNLACAAAPCPADLAPVGALDGLVSTPDLLFIINNWGACPALPDPCPADLAPVGALDGLVSTPDLLFIINNWGPCPK